MEKRYNTFEQKAHDQQFKKSRRGTDIRLGKEIDITMTAGDWFNLTAGILIVLFIIILIIVWTSKGI